MVSDQLNIGAELIRLGSILEHADTISHDKKVLFHCKMGGRSARAIRELEDTFGYQNLYTLKGGILAYVDEIKPELARY